MDKIKIKKINEEIFEDVKRNRYYLRKDGILVSGNKEFEYIETEDDFFAEEIPLEKRVQLLKSKAVKMGVEIVFGNEKNPFIDNDHLECFWYGGYIGSILYKGYAIDIVVQGEVDFSVINDENEIILEYGDKTNSSAFLDSDVKTVIKNDEHLMNLCNSGSLVYENNNWVEMFLRLPNDEDSGEVFDVLDDNVLEAFDGIEYYIALIEEKINDIKI
jgi:hypothetical protein